MSVSELKNYFNTGRLPPLPQTENNSRFFTDEKIKKIAYYAIGTVLALGAIAIVSIPTATMLAIPGGFGGLLYGLAACMPLFSFASIAYGSTIMDYNNPKALEKMKEAAAKEPSIDKLLRKHGTENLRKYNIVSDQRIREHQKFFDEGSALAKQNNSAYRAAIQSLDLKYPDRREAKIEKLKREKWSLQDKLSRQTFDGKDIQSEIAKIVNEEGGGFSYWAREKIAMLKAKVREEFRAKIGTINAEIDRVNNDPRAQNQQRLYNLEIKYLEKQDLNNDRFIDKNYPHIRGLAV